MGSAGEDLAIEGDGEFDAVDFGSERAACDENFVVQGVGDGGDLLVEEFQDGKLDLAPLLFEFGESIGGLQVCSGQCCESFFAEIGVVHLVLRNWFTDGHDTRWGDKAKAQFDVI